MAKCNRFVPLRFKGLMCWCAQLQESAFLAPVDSTARPMTPSATLGTHRMMTSRENVSSASCSNVVAVYRAGDDNVVVATRAQYDDVSVNAANVAGSDKSGDVERNPTCAK